MLPRMAGTSTVARACAFARSRSSAVSVTTIHPIWAATTTGTMLSSVSTMYIRVRI
jgi:hypothetical protein